MNPEDEKIIDEIIEKYSKLFDALATDDQLSHQRIIHFSAFYKKSF